MPSGALLPSPDVPSFKRGRLEGLFLPGWLSILGREFLQEVLREGKEHLRQGDVMLVCGLVLLSVLCLGVRRFGAGLGGGTDCVSSAPVPGDCP